MLVAEADYPFFEIVGTIIVFFAWMAWFWVLISILGDVFRRHDIHGGAKAAWTLLIVVVPFLGVLVYLIAQGRHMAERNAEQAKAQKAAFDEYVRDAAGGGAGGSGAASEIAQAQKLRDSGAISDEEFAQLKRKALA
jgi:uncharacterized membrane protein YcjF (UPF0283 family)